MIRNSKIRVMIITEVILDLPISCLGISSALVVEVAGVERNVIDKD